ncbi:WD repeat-containing protein [Thelephora ganbajun]|uniref:WD repeat-containing protein n=1 Tax=Thelephora ganbajun TaxID=370292 RepID=A0ACB6ZSE2_THEGA|nr:WD repeat-containing protein [Thelephora ganbajun]
MVADPSSVKVYTVNGPAAGASSSLPDWLIRKRASKKRKREQREHVEGTLELIQHFEFPEASNKVKTTRDGHYVIATGTYKPQMRVWDLDQLSLKFERHSDAENVDFLILSDDWTKTLHLQNDRSVALHNQGGFYHSTRIPKAGRAIAYHYPSCDAIVAASGHEVYRLNLNQGRFLNPLDLQNSSPDEVTGVNCIDINPAHQLLAFGCENTGTVQLWDPRSRSRAGLLRLPTARLLPTGVSLLPGVDEKPMVSVTTISSRSDGLSYAIGTSTGHTLLYDIRSVQPFATKDQGYGLPVKKVAWIDGGHHMAHEGLVLSADKKVIKLWDREKPAENFASITPANDLNDVHHIPGSGLIMLANEGIQMNTYYVPQLGPAPRWCSFLENLTEELEDQTTRTAYEDYKFVDRNELVTLGLDHLVGTPALKPYMHGYFLSLKLYDTARAIANPFAYAEHREKMLREKMDRLAESRIRAPKNAAVNVKVNKGLAERIAKEEAREKARAEKKAKKRASAAEEEQMEFNEDVAEKPGLINDPRFKALFEDPDFEVDEASREFALVNPSLAAKKREALERSEHSDNPRKTKTTVEEEEEEMEGMGDFSSDLDEESDEHSEPDSDDSSEGDDLLRDREYTKARRQQKATKPFTSVRMAPLKTDRGSSRDSRGGATFGARRNEASKTKRSSEHVKRSGDGGMELTWVPSSRKDRPRTSSEGGRQKKQPGVETFGAGMEKGGRPQNAVELDEAQRYGRTNRRQNVRSGSKNVFRRL